LAAEDLLSSLVLRVRKTVTTATRAPRIVLTIGEAESPIERPNRRPSVPPAKAFSFMANP
jgi:hypothetical protein